MNKSMLIGRTNGKPVTVKNDNLLFSVAVKEYYTDNKGVRIERTDWIDCQIWGKGAIALAGMINGCSRLISVVGKNRKDSYKDKNGVMVYRSYILVEAFEMLDPKPAATEFDIPEFFDYDDQSF